LPVVAGGHVEGATEDVVEQFEAVCLDLFVAVLQKLLYFAQTRRPCQRREDLHVFGQVEQTGQRTPLLVERVTSTNAIDDFLDRELPNLLCRRLTDCFLGGNLRGVRGGGHRDVFKGKDTIVEVEKAHEQVAHLRRIKMVDHFVKHGLVLVDIKEYFLGVGDDQRAEEVAPVAEQHGV